MESIPEGFVGQLLHTHANAIAIKTSFIELFASFTDIFRLS
jgi:hypothetical protein